MFDRILFFFPVLNLDGAMSEVCVDGEEMECENVGKISWYCNSSFDLIHSSNNE